MTSAQEAQKAAAALGVILDEAQAAAVAANLELLRVQAALFMTLNLPADLDPAELLRP